MKPGDVVQLKSGSPSMTIRWIDDDEAYCEWFDKAELKGARIALSSLEKIS